MLIFMHVQKVLKVQMHGNLSGDVLIGHSLICWLKQQRAQRHSGVDCSLPFLASEVVDILLIKFLPGNQFAQLDSVIIQIHRQCAEHFQ